MPGAESQQAIDLLKAHSPAFGGADSSLVFTVDEGKVSDPGPKAAIEGALAKIRGLTVSRWPRARSSRAGGLRGRAAGFGEVRTHRPGRIEKRTARR